MGTRGLLAFAHDGEVKATYNHFDSYPSGLGNAVAKFIAGGFDLDEAKALFKALVAVNEDEKPTTEQQAQLLKYFDDRVSTRSSEEWYALLRHTQGEPEEFLKAGFFIDNIEFAKDSLFCEWGYVVDLDREVLEIYKGFQTEDHTEGRFAGPRDEKYKPIRLVKELSFEEIRENPEILIELEDELYGGEDDD